MHIPNHDQILIVVFQVRQDEEHDGHMRQVGGSKSLGSKEVERKLLVSMVLCGLAMFLLVVTWLVRGDEGEEVEECLEEANPLPGPSVFWDYVEYSELAEHKLRH